VNFLFLNYRKVALKMTLSNGVYKNCKNKQIKWSGSPALGEDLSKTFIVSFLKEMFEIFLIPAISPHAMNHHNCENLWDVLQFIS